MADYAVSEFTTLRGLPEGWANAQATQQVVLWDCGPPKPLGPSRPKPPVGKEGDPEYDLAMIEFRDAVADYEVKLRNHKAKLAEYQEFQTKNGGPVEFVQWSCDAADTLKYDAAAVDEGRQLRPRYFVSHKTRGYAHLKNKGLPAGVVPGHGQADLERRTAEGVSDLIAARRSDPVFGQEEALS